MFETLLFYVLAAVLLVAGLRVITARNPVHGALFLVLAFFNAAGLWLLLGAEFLAIALVVVYVGAVMVLFLFVVMMLDINLERVREGFWRNLPLALVVAAIMLTEMILVLGNRIYDTAPQPLPASYSNTRALGRILYTDYAFAFEAAAVILLVAIIAAISLTLRRRKDTRAQDPSLQVRARREERVRLVSMPAEKE
ncbi:MAG TPA: NADH-quinone oxidoreductase subunit J [Burkholderiales bacterium]|nr:NADH-quinone oxidoreductase subunit J [Burkholderiales bacterium]